MPRAIVAIAALTVLVMAAVVACLCSAPSGAGVVRVVSQSSCQDDVRVSGEGMHFDACADLDTSRIDDLRGTWNPTECVRSTDGSGFGDVVPCEPSGDDTEAGA